MEKGFSVWGVLSFIIAGIAVTACSPPAPGLPISSEGKTADLYWLYSQFDENYAPLEYKQERHAFNYDALKKQYLSDAQDTKSNEEFYSLLYRFVSEFKDAHTSASIGVAELPGRAKIGYLGFKGVRKGTGLSVTELLPSMDVPNTTFPIHKGDLITRLDGQDLKTIVNTEMVKYRDLGQEESNLTYHMNKIFNRVSTSNGLPAKENATLTVERSGKTIEVQLPWIVEDLYDFSQEQNAAAAKSNGSGGEDEKKSDKDPGQIPAEVFQVGFLMPSGKLIETLGSAFDNHKRDISEILKLVRYAGFSFWDSFIFVENVPTWLRKTIDGAPPSPASNQASNTKPKFDSPVLEALSASRKVPTDAIPVEYAHTYPAYYTIEKILDAAGNDTGKTKNVGYILLDTFSPETAEDTAVAELDKTLMRFKQVGVKDVVIDMINNGGGSLMLGMKIAQLFSSTKIVQPDIQFRLSNTWMDDFINETRNTQRSKEERELFRRTYEDMKADLASGKRLSRKMSVETLMPLPLEPNEKLAGYPFNVVLLVNEMCASMCDIFTAIMKDNHAALVVGSKTMGAGGNVVSHPFAPNSHLVVNQTESLMVRRDGTYIENNGIEPDYPIAVNESVLEKYEPVRQTALKLLTNSMQTVPTPIAAH